MSFIFGGNTNMTYEDVQKKRALANQLAAQNAKGSRNVGEGLGAIGRALAYRAIDKRASKREGELDAEWEEQVGTMGLDPARAALYGRLDYGDRDAALLQHMNTMDAEKRANARAAAARGASAAKEAQKRAQEAATRQAIAQALQGQRVPTGAPMGPTQAAADAGAMSGADLTNMQTEYRAPDQNSVVNALLGNPNVPLNMIDDAVGFLPEQPEPGYEIRLGSELGLTGENAGQQFNVSPDGRVTPIGGGGTNVTVNNAGDSGPNIGTIPQGYSAIPDPSNPSGYRLAAIPGGPEDSTSEDAAKTSAQDTASDNVITAAQRARDAATGRSGPTALTGVVGTVNPYSDSAEVLRQTDVLKDITSAEQLNAMRRQSKTGGALGNVTERELGLLSRQGGALDPNSPNFERDLADYERAILRTIHGKEAGDNIFEATRQNTQSLDTFMADPANIAAAEKYGVTLEEMWEAQQ